MLFLFKAVEQQHIIVEARQEFIQPMGSKSMIQSIAKSQTATALDLKNSIKTMSSTEVSKFQKSDRAELFSMKTETAHRNLNDVSPVTSSKTEGLRNCGVQNPPIDRYEFCVDNPTIDRAKPYEPRLFCQPGCKCWYRKVSNDKRSSQSTTTFGELVRDCGFDKYDDGYGNVVISDKGMSWPSKIDCAYTKLSGLSESKNNPGLTEEWKYCEVDERPMTLIYQRHGESNFNALGPFVVGGPSHISDLWTNCNSLCNLLYCFVLPIPVPMLRFALVELGLCRECDGSLCFNLDLFRNKYEGPPAGSPNQGWVWYFSSLFWRSFLNSGLTIDGLPVVKKRYEHTVKKWLGYNEGIPAIDLDRVAVFVSPISRAIQTAAYTIMSGEDKTASSKTATTATKTAILQLHTSSQPYTVNGRKNPPELYLVPDAHEIQFTPGDDPDTVEKIVTRNHWISENTLEKSKAFQHAYDSRPDIAAYGASSSLMSSPGKPDPAIYGIERSPKYKLLTPNKAEAHDTGAYFDYFKPHASDVYLWIGKCLCPWNFWMHWFKYWICCKCIPMGTSPRDAQIYRSMITGIPLNLVGCESLENIWRFLYIPPNMITEWNNGYYVMMATGWLYYGWWFESLWHLGSSLLAKKVKSTKEWKGTCGEGGKVFYCTPCVCGIRKSAAAASLSMRDSGRPSRSNSKEQVAFSQAEETGTQEEEECCACGCHYFRKEAKCIQFKSLLACLGCAAAHPILGSIANSPRMSLGCCYVDFCMDKKSVGCGMYKCCGGSGGGGERTDAGAPTAGAGAVYGPTDAGAPTASASLQIQSTKDLEQQVLTPEAEQTEKSKSWYKTYITNETKSYNPLSPFNFLACFLNLASAILGFFLKTSYPNCWTLTLPQLRSQNVMDLIGKHFAGDDEEWKRKNIIWIAAHSEFAKSVLGELRDWASEVGEYNDADASGKAYGAKNLLLKDCPSGKLQNGAIFKADVSFKLDESEGKKKWILYHGIHGESNDGKFGKNVAELGDKEQCKAL